MYIEWCQEWAKFYLELYFVIHIAKHYIGRFELKNLGSAK